MKNCKVFFLFKYQHNFVIQLCHIQYSLANRSFTFPQFEYKEIRIIISSPFFLFELITNRAIIIIIRTITFNMW